MTLSTHITVVIDKSGSMGAVAEEASQAINNLLEEQKSVEGECSLSTYLFNGIVTRTYQGDLRDAPAFQINPSGMTALNDAIGRAINETGAFLRDKPKAERPEKVIFVIATDGHENVSSEFTLEKVKEMIEHQTNVYNWEFVFLAAGMDVQSQSTALGFTNTNTVLLRSSTGHAHEAAYAGLSSTITSSRGGADVTYGATYADDGTLVTDSNN